MASSPFSLRIFIVDGDPDGLRLVERSNWVGKTRMFPSWKDANARTLNELQAMEAGA